MHGGRSGEDARGTSSGMGRRFVDRAASFITLRSSCTVQLVLALYVHRCFAHCASRFAHCASRLRDLAGGACAFPPPDSHFVVAAVLPFNPPVMRYLALLSLAFAASPLLAQQAPPTTGPAVNWDAVRDETVGMMREYFRINTTNPPGNELQTALWLKKVLEKEGFETQIL